MMANPRDLYRQYSPDSPENPYHRSNQYDPKKLKSQYPPNSPKNPYHRSNQYDPKKLKNPYLQPRADHPNDPDDQYPQVRRNRPPNIWRLSMYLGITAICIVGIVSTLIFLHWQAATNFNVSMTRIGFTRTSVYIDPGEAIHFQNSADGVTQILCPGVNQHCQPESVGQPFYRGLIIHPSQTVDVVFNASGTYPITSTTTPHMNITIIVVIPRSGGVGGGG